MKKLPFFLLFLVFGAGTALAATLSILDGTGASKTVYGAACPGSSFCPGNTIWDATAGANGLAITAGGAAKVDASATTQPVSAASGTFASGSVAAGAFAAGSVVDGASITQGAKADTAASSGTGTFSVVALLKGILNALQAVIPGNAIGTGSANLFTIGAVANANGDPCSSLATTYVPISVVTATTVQIAAPVSAKKIYVCGLSLFAGAADNVAVIEGTGGTCGGGTVAGVLGGTTTGAGFIFSASTGTNLVNTGARTATVAQGLCLITSTTGPLTGGLTYVAN